MKILPYTSVETDNKFNNSFEQIQNFNNEFNEVIELGETAYQNTKIIKRNIDN